MVSVSDLWGSGVGGGSASPFGGQASKQIFNAMLNPQFYQAWAALTDAGVDPWQELSQFLVSGKGAKKQAKGQPGYIPLGKGNFINSGALAQKLPEYKQQGFDANIKATQAAYDKLLETPAYATLAAQSKGQFSDDYNKSVDAVINPMLAQTQGGIAGQGFAGSVQKQASAIAGASQMKAQYLTEAQKSAQSYLQQLAGFGGAPGGGAFATSGLSAPGGYMNPMFAAAGMNMGNNQFNAGLDFQQQMFKNQVATGWFDKAMAAAGSAPWGSMGGGGYGGGSSGMYQGFYGV